MQGGICKHARPTMGLGTCPPLGRGVLTCQMATRRPEGPTRRLSFWQLRYLHARPTMGLGTCLPLSRRVPRHPGTAHRLEGMTIRRSFRNFHECSTRGSGTCPPLSRHLPRCPVAAHRREARAAHGERAQAARALPEKDAAGDAPRDRVRGARRALAARRRLALVGAAQNARQLFSLALGLAGVVVVVVPSQDEGGCESAADGACDKG